MNVDGRTIRQAILDTRFRGYDVGQVDELLEKIAHAMDVLDAANRELWRKKQGTGTPIDKTGASNQ